MAKKTLAVQLVKKGEKTRVYRKLPGGKNPLSYTYHALTHIKNASRLKPFLMEFQPGIREEIPLVSHEGEEFLYLLEGELEFQTTSNSWELKPGDSLHFDAQVPHGFINKGKKTARAIAVIWDD